MATHQIFMVVLAVLCLIALVGLALHLRYRVQDALYFKRRGMSWRNAWHESGRVL